MSETAWGVVVFCLFALLLLPFILWIGHALWIMLRDLFAPDNWNGDDK